MARAGALAYPSVTSLDILSMVAELTVQKITTDSRGLAAAYSLHAKYDSRETTRRARAAFLHRFGFEVVNGCSPGIVDGTPPGVRVHHCELPSIVC